MYICTWTYIYSFIHWNTYICTYAYNDTRINFTNIHPYTYTYIYFTYIHIYILHTYSTYHHIYRSYEVIQTTIRT